MFWESFFEYVNAPFRVFSGYLYHHQLISFRAILFGGDVMMVLLLLLSIQGFFYAHHAYYVWLASLTAVLGLIFIFVRLSAYVNGYRQNRDRWLNSATGLMLALSFFLAVSAIVTR